MNAPKYPDVRVKLIGKDGNAFFIVGRVAAALKNAGVSDKKRAVFVKEATSGDYNNVLRTCMKWVDIY